MEGLERREEDEEEKEHENCMIHVRCAPPFASSSVSPEPGDWWGTSPNVVCPNAEQLMGLELEGPQAGAASHGVTRAPTSFRCRPDGPKQGGCLYQIKR